MKKVLLFTLALSLLFIGCSKDDTPESKPILTGTEWVRVSEGITLTIDFFNATECKYTIDTYAAELYEICL